MAATIKMIREWFAEAKRQKATHMVVVCDTFDWEDYPIYVLPGQDLRTICIEHDDENMQRIMEVYEIAKGEKCINSGSRVYHGYKPGVDKPKLRDLLGENKRLTEQLKAITSVLNNDWSWCENCQSWHHAKCACTVMPLCKKCNTQHSVHVKCPKKASLKGKKMKRNR